MGWLAASPVQMLHLETMEETPDKSKEPYKTGDSGVAGMGSKQLSESLLEYGKEWSCTKGYLKGLDTTASLTGTSLCTYAIEPPCTERYARWCERSATQLMGSLLLYFRLWPGETLIFSAARF